MIEAEIPPRPNSLIETDFSAAADTAERLAASLRRRLQEPLPGRTAQAFFEPELAYGRHFDRPAFDARDAAVVILLYRRDGRWHLPLTVRPPYMPVHAGQVCLPGGVVDEGETGEQAALRELEEELGVAAADVAMLGRLSPLYIFGTRFHVEPWIAVAAKRPAFKASEFEVEELLEVPVAYLADPAHRGRHVRSIRGVEQSVPHVEWRGHRIWGATAMILGELSAVWADMSATIAGKGSAT